jgi:hypothetical protein
MGYLFSLVGRLLQTIGELALPFFAGVRKNTRVVLQVVHVCFLGVILVGLWFINARLKTGSHIDNSVLRATGIWLPVLFLLIYAIVWVVWWLYWLLRSGEETAEFPDIELAWNEAKATLEKMGFDLSQLPLFLILGRPEQDERNLFAASQLTFPVRSVPNRADAPLRVYATHEAIYVICPGASLLGLHAGVLSGKIALDAPTEAVEGSNAEDQPDFTMTIVPGKKRGARNFQAAFNQITGMGRTLMSASRTDQHMLRAEARRQRPAASLARHPDHIAVQESRLRFFCNLLLRDRQPYCPINGLLLLLPFAATDSVQDAVDTGDLSRIDLETVRSALQINCPVIGMVCDVEVARGFGEFVRLFAPREKQRRLGQKFPLYPEYGRDATADTPMAALETLSEWVCSATLAGWVFQKFQLETQQRVALETTIQDNGELFMFLDEIRWRKKHLSMMLTRGLRLKNASPLLFGGLYFAATGMVAGEQAFVAGVLDRLVKEQNYVSWTEEAFEEEARLNRSIYQVYTILAVAVLGILALYGYLLLFRKW